MEDKIKKKEAFVTRQDIFDKLLREDATVLTTYSGTCKWEHLSLHDIQRKFIKYYLHHTNNKSEVIMPVLKMRQFGGMTTILQEIAIIECLSGKKVLYCVPNQPSCKATKDTINYKLQHSEYMPSDKGVIDVKYIDPDNYFTSFNVSVTSKRYDLIIVDEVPLSNRTSLRDIHVTLNSYLPLTPSNAIISFTLSPPSKYYKETKEYIEQQELNNNLFRYTELTDKSIKYIQEIVHCGDDDMLKNLLVEMLGIESEE